MTHNLQGFFQEMNLMYRLPVPFTECKLKKWIICLSAAFYCQYD